MNQNHDHDPQERSEHGVHFLLPLIWLLLALVLIYAVVQKKIGDVESTFSLQTAVLTSQVGEALQSNEAVLEGFASLLAVVSGADREEVRRYAQRMRERYPHVFMLEVAQRVPVDGIEAFERRMRASVCPDFAVRNFDYDETREWTSLPRKPEYYPIVFMEPMTDDSRKILGLDLDSVPFLSMALGKSLRLNRSVSSHPFSLIEGGWAYVMHRAVGQRQDVVALLVIKASELLSERTLAVAGLEVGLWHGDFAPGDARGLILRRAPAATAGALERRLLPKIEIRTELGGIAQPFVLTAERQIRFADLDLPLMTLLGAINLAFLVLLLRYAMLKRRVSLERSQRSRQWAYLASHDPLTALPNRVLLMDRLNGALRRAQREGTTCAVLFMDIDRFKEVNDTYGHQVGDLVLQHVSNGIRSALRAQDTVARISGDEFVAVVEKIGERAQADAIATKVLGAVPGRLGEEYPDMSISLSLGIAVYPDDGRTADELLRQADAAMYEMKRRSRSDGR